MHYNAEAQWMPNFLSPDEAAECAVAMSRLVHERCRDVPHDIGLDLFRLCFPVLRRAYAAGMRQGAKVIQNRQGWRTVGGWAINQEEAAAALDRLAGEAEKGA